MKQCDLFAGIGGFSLAAHWFGIQTTQFVEIDPYCQQVLAKNFPGVPIHDDITTFTPTPGQFDIITAGFPHYQKRLKALGNTVVPQCAAIAYQRIMELNQCQF